MIALTFPSVEQLQPSLDKLITHPGSVVLIAITIPTAESGMQTQNYPEVGTAWFCKVEADGLRAALNRVRLKRQKVTGDLAIAKEGKGA